VSVVDEEVAAACSELLNLARTDPNAFLVFESERQKLEGQLVAAAQKADKQLGDANRLTTQMMLRMTTLVDDVQRERDAVDALVTNSETLVASLSPLLPKFSEVLDNFGACHEAFTKLCSAIDEKHAEWQAGEDSDMVVERDQSGRITGFRNVPEPLTADGSMTQAEYDRQIARLTWDIKTNGNGDGHGEAS
jgi:hypothetical protein